MKLTICFDDISLPLPPMEAPDIRQMVIETVLDMAAEAGVDDVVLIAALALHRRMTEEELRHALGDRVYDAFAPHGLLTQHDAEDPDNLLYIGETDQGEEVEINKRAATSDLLVYVNINLVAMDGGHKSVATGLASYRSLRHHHNPQTMRHSKSFMDQHRSELHSSNWRMGRLIAESGVKVFQIETTLNNDTFPSNFAIPAEAGVGVVAARPGHVHGDVEGVGQDPAAPGPPDLPLHPVPPRADVGAGRGGRGRPRADHSQRLGAAGRRGRGANRHLDHGAAVHLPLQRQLDHEPDPGGVSRPRLLLQHVQGQAARARGRRGDHAPPDAAGVPPRRTTRATSTSTSRC